MSDESESRSYSEAESDGDDWGTCKLCEKDVGPDGHMGLCYDCAGENAMMEAQCDLDNCAGENAMMEAQWDLDNSLQMIPIDKLRAGLPSHMSVKEVLGRHSKPCSVCGYNDWKPRHDWYVYNHVLPEGTIKCCVACAEENLGDPFQDPMNDIMKLFSQLPPDMEIAQVLTDNHRKPCSNSKCEYDDWDIGDWYVSNKKNPHGTAKYCLECAEKEYKPDDAAKTTSGQSQEMKRSAAVAVSPSQSPKKRKT